VNHTINTVGYEISSKDGKKKIFYSGDTGPGLSTLWEHISPQLLIIEVTFPNRMEKRTANSKHLCPKLLKSELMEFQRVKGYYPKVWLIHLSPKHEKEIREEVKEISRDLHIPIEIAVEGKTITV